MKKIFKYIIEPTDDISGVSKVTMPYGAEILSVDSQYGHVCVWAIVDEVEKGKEMFFEIIPTGGAVYENMGIDRKFLGTVKMFDDSLIFHIFQRTD